MGLTSRSSCSASPITRFTGWFGGRAALNRQRIDHSFAHDPSVRDRFQLHYADLADASSLSMVMEQVRPDEVYNLGAQSHVRVSFDQPLYTADVVGLGTLRLLEAVRQLNRVQPVKFYQASSSEMYGSAPPPQGLDTPFHPRSPYACAKLYAHWQTINYREAYGMFACSGILFNHESPRRGESFVTRKVTLGATRIKEGLQKKLVMGNLDAKRDWGFAGDYVRAMWMMLQQDKPEDYVVATGETHSVREFLELAFSYRRARLSRLRRVRPQVHPPVRSRCLAGRSDQGARSPGMEAGGRLPRPGQDDGRARPGTGPARKARRVVSGSLSKTPWREWIKDDRGQDGNSANVGSVAVACPDARPPAYQAVIGLERAGRLQTFLTSSYYDPEGPLARLARRLAPNRFFRLEKALLRRHDAEIPAVRVAKMPSVDLRCESNHDSRGDRKAGNACSRKREQPGSIGGWPRR